MLERPGCTQCSEWTAFLQHKHIWRSGRGRKNKGKQKKEENTGISNSNPTKILEQDRGCPKGSQLLGKCFMLGKNGAGNNHKMFVFQVFCTLPLSSWHSGTLCLFSSSSYPSCSLKYSDSSPSKYSSAMLGKWVMSPWGLSKVFPSKFGKRARKILFKKPLDSKILLKD